MSWLWVWIVFLHNQHVPGLKWTWINTGTIYRLVLSLFCFGSGLNVVAYIWCSHILLLLLGGCENPSNMQHVSLGWLCSDVCTCCHTMILLLLLLLSRPQSTPPPWLSFSSQPCHPSLLASSLQGPRCPPPADRQMCKPVLWCSFYHASVPTEPNH